MECLHCQGQMRQGSAPFSVDRNGYHLSWDAIPAWVCDQCGEVLFEAREVNLIQETLSVLDRETAVLVGKGFSKINSQHPYCDGSMISKQDGNDSDHNSRETDN